MKFNAKCIILLMLIFSLMSITVYAAPGDADSSDITDVENPSGEDGETTEVVEPEPTEVVFPSRVVMREKEVVPEGSNYVIEEYVEPVEDDPNIYIHLNEKGVYVDREGNPVEMAKVITFYNADTNEELFTVEDKEYELFLADLSESIGEEALAGLEALSTSSVTLDHIQLKVWGEFLNKYYNKSHLNFPLGDIALKFGKHNFVIVNNDLSKDLVEDTIIPTLINAIKEYSREFPVKRYSLQIIDGATLSEFNLDLNNIREVATYYPFDDIETYSFFNTGSYYAVSLNNDYVDVLRGYIEGNKIGYDRPVEGEYPGCVNVLSYVVLLDNMSGYTFTDKHLTDFDIYQNLAVTLDTKELVDTTDMTTVQKTLYFSDYKLDPEKLLVLPISDTCVILQPTYLECFMYQGINRSFNRTLDITHFVTTGDKNFTTVDAQGNEVLIPLDRFIDDMGRIGVQLGNAPFLVYYTDYVPYDLLINFAYNQTASYFGDDLEARDAFVDTIRKELNSLGRSNDFDDYMMAAGQKTDRQKRMTTIIIVSVVALIVVVGIVVVVIIISKKKKQDQMNAATNNRRGLAFGDDEDTGFSMDDDDDDDGGFELK